MFLLYLMSIWYNLLYGVLNNLVRILFHYISLAPRKSFDILALYKSDYYYDYYYIFSVHSVNIFSFIAVYCCCTVIVLLLSFVKFQEKRKQQQQQQQQQQVHHGWQTNKPQALCLQVVTAAVRSTVPWQQ